MEIIFIEDTLQVEYLCWRGTISGGSSFWLYPSKRAVGDDGTCSKVSPMAVLACFSTCSAVIAEGFIKLVDTGIILQLIAEIQKFVSLVTSLSAKLSLVKRCMACRRVLAM